MLLVASRDVPTALLVDEVLGFRRFASGDFDEKSPVMEIRCERYLAGVWTGEDGDYPLFDVARLLEDQNFLNAGALKAG